MTQDIHDFEHLKTYDGPDRVISSDEMRLMIAALPPKKKISIGLGALDSVVDGIEPGELIAIGGPTKHGKTLLGQTITRNLAEFGTNVIWFTFEVPEPQFLAQMPKEVRFYLPRELELRNIEWLFKRLTESKLKYKTEVAFIDNLHHLFDLAQNRNPSLDIGVIIRHLKRMAITLEMTIFILCHSRKPIESKGALPEVSEWDLRDSSFIPQEADSTWMIQRKMDKATKQYGACSFVKVCNHRRTGAMGRVINLVKIGQLLDEDPRKEDR